jgi:hypothetical protein
MGFRSFHGKMVFLGSSGAILEFLEWLEWLEFGDFQGFLWNFEGFRVV